MTCSRLRPQATLAVCAVCLVHYRPWCYRSRLTVGGGRRWQAVAGDGIVDYCCCVGTWGRIDTDKHIGRLFFCRFCIILYEDSGCEGRRKTFDSLFDCVVYVHTTEVSHAVWLVFVPSASVVWYAYTLLLWFNLLQERSKGLGNICEREASPRCWHAGSASYPLTLSVATPRGWKSPTSQSTTC